MGPGSCPVLTSGHFSRHGRRIAMMQQSAKQRKDFGVDKVPDLGAAQLRIARPTDDLAAVVAFYRDGLGFEVLSSFTGHDGFDGVMLGFAGAGYHLEFTRAAGH